MTAAQDLGGLSQTQLVAHLNALADKHPCVAEALNRTGTPLTRRNPRGFPTLLSAIVGQQISTTAAAAIRGRLWALMDGTPTATRLAALTWDELRAAGLSGRKIDYAQGLAAAIIEGALCLETLKSQDDSQATKTLVALKGFGPWTAQIYLLFSEGREDVFPPADLALERGLQILLNLPETPSSKEAVMLAAQFSPHRSALCLLLWALYGAASLD